MNKTVLLACCDFLILATLSLNYNPQSDTPVAQDESLPVSNDFSIQENDISTNQDLFVFNAIYEKKLSALQEEKSILNDELEHKDEDLANLKELHQSLQKKYQTLLSQQGNSEAIFDLVNSARLELTVNIKEDDSFNPDSLRLQTYTPAITHSGINYAVVHRDNLGFNWPELTNDGHISDYSLILSKKDSSPWSYRSTVDVEILNENTNICLIPLSSNITIKPLPVLQNSPGKYLKNLYAFKSDGRLIQVVQATTLPGKVNEIELSEKRFLGQPDQLKIGNSIITESGLAVGMITNTIIDGNTIRHIATLFSAPDFSNISKIPVTKKKGDKYFSELVNEVLRVR